MNQISLPLNNSNEKVAHMNEYLDDIIRLFHEQRMYAKGK